jgi:hypothetical protein
MLLSFAENTTVLIKDCHRPAEGGGEGEGGAHGGPVRQGGQHDAAGSPQFHHPLLSAHLPPAHQAAQVAYARRLTLDSICSRSLLAANCFNTC